MSALLIVLGLTAAALPGTAPWLRGLRLLGALLALGFGAAVLFSPPQTLTLPWLAELPLHFKLDAVSGFVALTSGALLLLGRAPAAELALPLLLLSAGGGPASTLVAWLLLMIAVARAEPAPSSPSDASLLQLTRAAEGVAVTSGLLLLGRAQGWSLYDGFYDHDLALGAAAGPALVAGALLHLCRGALLPAGASPWSALAATLLIALACPDAPQLAVLAAGLTGLAGLLAAWRGGIQLPGVALGGLAVAAALAHAEPAGLLLAGALALTLGSGGLRSDGEALPTRVALLSLGGLPLGAVEVARRAGLEALRSQELGLAIPLALAGIGGIGVTLGRGWPRAPRRGDLPRAAALAAALLALPLAYNALRGQFGQHPKELLGLWLQLNPLSLIALLLTGLGAWLGWRRSR